MLSCRVSWAVATISALLLAPAPAAQDGIGLRDLPALAKVRADRQRPGRLAALEPYLADLRTDHRRNGEVLEPLVTKIVALGDSVQPMLVELLTPADDDSRARFLAENCARILARMEPAKHVQTWTELAEGSHELGQRLGLMLLGESKDPSVATTLARLFPLLGTNERRMVAIRAAENVGTDRLAPLVAPLIQSADAEARQHALAHLSKVGYAQAVPLALEALRNERENRLLGDYLDFFSATVKGDEAIADALLPLVQDSIRLDADDLVRLVHALATIAPEKHRGTTRALLDLLETQPASALATEAAMTLWTLGEKRGKKILLDNFEQRLRRDRQDPNILAERGAAHLAFGMDVEAIKDYTAAAQYSTVTSRRQHYYLQIARAEAHRKRVPAMKRALKETAYSTQKILSEAAGDPIFLEQLTKAGYER